MPKYILAPYQVALLLVLSRTIAPIIFLPVVTLGETRTSAWVAALIAIFPSLILGWLILKLASKFPKETIIEYAPKLLGRWLGGILSLSLIFFFFFNFSFTLRQFGEFVVNSSMPETPIEVFAGLLAIGILYGVNQGVETIARGNAFVLPIILGSVFLAIIGAAPNMKAEALLPIISVPWLEIFKGVLLVFSWFAELTVLLILYPMINKPREAHLPIYGSIIFSCIFVAIIAISTIAVLGPLEAMDQTYPFYSVVKMISLADVIERLESIFLAIWTASVYLKGCIYLFCTLYSLSQFLNLKDYKALASPLALLGIFTSIFMANNYPELNSLFSLPSWLPFIMVFSLMTPILLVVISIFRKSLNNGQG
jgi:spore germination protein KB